MALNLTDISEYLMWQSWQIAVVFAVVAIACRLLRHASAHWRYLLWLLVLTKCVMPPLVTVPVAVLPGGMTASPEPALKSAEERSWARRATRSEAEAPSPTPQADGIAAETAKSEANTAGTITSAPMRVQPETQTQEPTTTHGPADGEVGRAAVVPAARATAALTWRQRAAVGWVAGLVLLLGLAGIRAIRIEAEMRRKRLPAGRDLVAETEQLGEKLGLRRPVRVWLVDGIAQPFVWGVLRGDIYLPADFRKTGTSEHRRGILMHEMAHVARHDAAVNMVQILVQAGFFFHPLVWWANHCIRQEREKCCDEAAIANLGAPPRQYGEAIVSSLVREYESTRAVSSLAVAGPVRNIEERIKTILRPNRRFHCRASRLAVVSVALLGTLSIPTAVVLTVRQADHAPSSSVVEIEPANVEVDDATPPGDKRSAGVAQDTPGAASSQPAQDAGRTKIEILEKARDLLYPQRQLWITMGHARSGKPLRASLASGVSVALSGVGRAPYSEMDWWRPDGEWPIPPLHAQRIPVPLDEGGRPAGIEMPTYKGEADSRMPILTPREPLESMPAPGVPAASGPRFSFVVQFEDIPAEGAAFTWVVSPSSEEPAFRRVMLWPKNQGKPLEFEEIVPKSVSTAVVQVGVAAGPWTKAGEMPAVRNPTVGSSFASRLGTLTATLDDRFGTTCLMVFDTFEKHDVWIAAVDRDGTTHEPSFLNTPTGAAHIHIAMFGYKDLPIDRIDHFEVRVRPYQWITFSNVSLKRGEATDVKIRVSDKGAPATQPAAGQSTKDDLLERGRSLLEQLQRRYEGDVRQYLKDLPGREDLRHQAEELRKQAEELRKQASQALQEAQRLNQEGLQSMDKLRRQMQEDLKQSADEKTRELIARGLQLLDEARDAVERLRQEAGGTPQTQPAK